MAEYEVKVNKMVSFTTEAEKDDDPLAESLRSSTGMDDLAFLTLSDASTYAVNKQDQRYPIWSKFLDKWRGYDLPLYVTAEKGSGLVDSIVAPDVKQVQSVGAEPKEGRLKVVPFATPTLYYLSTEHPNYEELKKRLEKAATAGGAAMIFIDPESPLNDNMILDVRLFEDPEGPAEELPNGVVTEAKARVLFDELAFSFRSELDPVEAQEQFNDLRDNHDIPFHYIIDCCKARSHKMCLVLRERQIFVRKVWNYGHGMLVSANADDWERTLIFATPRGEILWFFHTAPVIRVLTSGGQIVQRVIDPAIFDRPESIDNWVARQSDRTSRLRFSQANIYWRDPDGNVLGVDVGVHPAKLEFMSHMTKLARRPA